MEIHFAYGPYKSYTFTVFGADFGYQWDNIGKDRPGIQRFSHLAVYYDGHNRSPVRNVAHGRWALDYVVYNQTTGRFGSYFSFCLGGNAFTYGTGMGIGSNMAVLRFLMFVSKLAPAFVVAGNFSNLVHSLVPEFPAFNRGNFHSVDYSLVLKSSSERF